MLDKPTDATFRRTNRRPMALACLIGALCIAPFSLVQGQFATSASLKTASNPAIRVAAKKAGKATIKHAKLAAKQTPMFATTASSKLTMHVFRLKNADAERAAEVLHQVLGSGSGGRVAADSRSNSIVVNADEATTKQIASVIQNLEEINHADLRGSSYPKEPQQVTVYGLKYADSEELFDVLHTIYGNPAFAVVKATSDHRTNSIVVTCPENRVREVSELITKLDVPTPEVPLGKRKITRMIKVRFGDPKQIISRVNAMMNKDAPEYIAPDLTTNDIIVVTTEENCNRVQSLVNMLDVQKVN